MRHPYMMAIQNRERKMNGAHVDTSIRRVTWTDDELGRVAREAFAVLQADRSLSNMEAVRRAQANVLPSERHRVIRQERDLSSMLPIWIELRVAKKTAPPEPIPKPVASEVVEAPASTGFEAEEPKRGRPTLETVRAEQQQMLETSLAASDDKRRLVRWTSDEKRKVARESKRLRSTNLGMTRLDAIRRAIESELPPDRRRDIKRFELVDWIEAEWQMLEDIERADQAEREAREQTAELERQAEESRRATEAARAEAEAAKAIDPASLPFATLIEAIGVKIAGMLLRSIGEQLQESIMQRITEALGNVTLPSPGVLPEGATRMHAAPRDRKPRVLVVGLVRQQEDDVSRALGELFRFDYARVEHADNLEEKARGADLVVLMTKFISHKHQDIVRRVNEHIVYRNGGVTELKRWLTQWINGEVVTATA
ncbi:hypothetical protein ISI04_08875 [Burkholderia pseudomallei]|nr:hypothetical protein [Burkholderia pseudomallei]